MTHDNAREGASFEDLMAYWNQGAKQKTIPATPEMFGVGAYLIRMQPSQLRDIVHRSLKEGVVPPELIKRAYAHFYSGGYLNNTDIRVRARLEREKWIRLHSGSTCATCNGSGQMAQFAGWGSAHAAIRPCYMCGGAKAIQSVEWIV